MQLKFIIFGWIILVFYSSLFVGSTDIVVYTVATDATDGYKRMIASAKLYNISVQTLGMGEQWQGGNVALFAGGGQKINILREEMARYKDDRDTVVLFVDGYDVVFTAGAEELLKAFNRFEARILFSAEDACWPDSSLKDFYPLVKANEKRFLNSGGFMGYAYEVYEMLRVADVKHSDDDQLYFTHIYLNESLRTDLKIKLDKRADIFLNMNGALDDVQLKFKGAQSYLYNNKTGNTPLILHGNGPIKVQFNRLMDYVPNKWTPSVGCVDCFTGTLSLSTLQPDDFPMVFMAVFLSYPIPFIEDFFQRLAALNYPKHRINVFLHYGVEFHDSEVKAFAKNHGSDYHRLTILGPTEGVTGAAAKNKALEECMLAQCQYMFVVDGEVQLDNRQTLQLLIERNRSVIAPLVFRPGKLWSNFWGLLTDNGFYQRSEDYIAILEGERRGQWNVPYISSVYLIHGYHIPHLQGSYGDGTVDADMAFTQNLRNKGIFMYVDNLEVSYGHLVNSEDFDTSHLHNDLYTIFSNPHTWALKYIHENYSHALDPNTVNLQPCPDVFQFPIVSEAFCRDLVEEVEFFGQWSNGKNEDSRLVTGYENVPTVDIHTNQISWEPHWLHFLKTYILPLNLKVFPGYYSEGKSIMNFVVRYKPTEQSFLRPHHDSSTFSINIALNQPTIDFEGGGTKFIRYNCSVLDSPRGWMLMHPGRLTHYHEGLKVTTGTRYIMIAFVDP